MSKVSRDLSSTTQGVLLSRVDTCRMNKGVFSTIIYKRQNATHCTRRPFRRILVLGHSGDHKGVSRSHSRVFQKAHCISNTTLPKLSPQTWLYKNDFYFSQCLTYIYKKHHPDWFSKKTCVMIGSHTKNQFILIGLIGTNLIQIFN